MNNSALKYDPRPQRRARIVSADRARPEMNSPARLGWLCECGHRGCDIPDMEGWCPSCKGAIRIPAEPFKGNPEEVLAAIERGCGTCNGCTPRGFKCRTCGAEA